jgi:hypothetical protein
MIYTRKEGEVMRNGFNNYPKDDPLHGGGVFYWNGFKFWYRLRKTWTEKRWVIGSHPRTIGLDPTRF